MNKIVYFLVIVAVIAQAYAIPADAAAGATGAVQQAAGAAPAAAENAVRPAASVVSNPAAGGLDALVKPVKDLIGQAENTFNGLIGMTQAL